MTVEETCKKELTCIRDFIGGEAFEMFHSNMITIGAVGSKESIKQMKLYKPGVSGNTFSFKIFTPWIINRNIHAMCIGHTFLSKLEARRFNKTMKREGLLLITKNPLDLAPIYFPDKVDTDVADIMELYDSLPETQKK